MSAVCHPGTVQASKRKVIEHCLLIFNRLDLFVQGFYDRGKELNWKNMKDIQFVGAMGPPGGARNMLDPRFVSLFDAFEVQFPSTSNLQTIYTSILTHHVAALSEEIRGVWIPAVV